MAYQTFTHQIWWVMACYDLAHQIRCAKHTFHGQCDITPMVCCSFDGHSTPQFLQCRERVTEQLRENNMPFTIIADEATDPHSNQEILSVCFRYVDRSSPTDHYIKECLISFVFLDQTNASSISRKILATVSGPSVYLDPCRIRGQEYDGVSVMASGITGVQSKVKEVRPLAMYTHCYSHCFNLSIARAEVRNLILLINEAHLVFDKCFLTNGQ